MFLWFHDEDTTPKQAAETEVLSHHGKCFPCLCKYRKLKTCMLVQHGDERHESLCYPTPRWKRRHHKDITIINTGKTGVVQLDWGDRKREFQQSSSGFSWTLQYCICIPKQKGGLAKVFFFAEGKKVLSFTCSRHVKNTRKVSGLSIVDDPVTLTHHHLYRLIIFLSLAQLQSMPCKTFSETA